MGMLPVQSYFYARFAKDRFVKDEADGLFLLVRLDLLVDIAEAFQYELHQLLINRFSLDFAYHLLKRNKSRFDFPPPFAQLIQFFIDKHRAVVIGHGRPFVHDAAGEAFSFFKVFFESGSLRYELRKLGLKFRVRRFYDGLERVFLGGQLFEAGDDQAFDLVSWHLEHAGFVFTDVIVITNPMFAGSGSAFHFSTAVFAPKQTVVQNVGVPDRARGVVF